MTVHDISYARAPELFSRRDRTLLRLVRGSVRRAARVIAVSEFTRRDLCEVYGVDPAKVAAIPNGVSSDVPARRRRRRSTCASASASTGRTCSASARCSRARTSRSRSRPTRGSWASGTDCELVVAGGDRGGRLDVLDAILRTRLTGRVHLVGRVEDEELPPLYTGARALLFPSLYEGFGLPALEAMACGTPVVASNTTGLAEAVGDAGLTVDPRSADELAEALRRLLDDQALRERLVAPGLARAAEFTWARMAAAHGRRLPRRRWHDAARGRDHRLARPARPARGVPGGARARRRGGARVRERPRRQRRARALARASAPTSTSGRARSRRTRTRSSPPRPSRTSSRSIPTCALARRLRRPARRACRGACALRHRRPAPARARTATLQRSRRRFPTIGGTLVRRTPLRALLRDVEAAQPGHYLSDVPDRPVECDWMLGACLLAAPDDAGRARRLRRGLPDVRRGHRAAVPRRARPAGSAGTSRTRSRRTTTSASSTARSSHAARGGTCGAWRATCAATRRRCCGADAEVAGRSHDACGQRTALRAWPQCAAERFVRELQLYRPPRVALVERVGTLGGQEPSEPPPRSQASRQNATNAAARREGSRAAWRTTT